MTPNPTLCIKRTRQEYEKQLKEHPGGLGSVDFPLTMSDGDVVNDYESLWYKLSKGVDISIDSEWAQKRIRCIATIYTPPRRAWASTVSIYREAYVQIRNLRERIHKNGLYFPSSSIPIAEPANRGLAFSLVVENQAPKIDMVLKVVACKYAWLAMNSETTTIRRENVLTSFITNLLAR